MVHLGFLSYFHCSKFVASLFLVFSRLPRWSREDAVTEAWVCCWQEDDYFLDWSQGCQTCLLFPEALLQAGSHGRNEGQN